MLQILAAINGPISYGAYLELLPSHFTQGKSFTHTSFLGPILVIPTSLCFPVNIFGESGVLMAGAKHKDKKKTSDKAGSSGRLTILTHMFFWGFLNSIFL